MNLRLRLARILNRLSSRLNKIAARLATRPTMDKEYYLLLADYLIDHSDAIGLEADGLRKKRLTGMAEDADSAHWEDTATQKDFLEMARWARYFMGGGKLTYDEERDKWHVPPEAAEGGCQR